MIEKRVKMFFSCLCWCILVFLLIGHVDAQSERGKGRLRGIVFDETGKPLTNAGVHLVWLKDQTLGRRTQTNKNGKFRFVDLGSGEWEIRVTAALSLARTRGGWPERIETTSARSTV